MKSMLLQIQNIIHFPEVLTLPPILRPYSKLIKEDQKYLCGQSEIILSLRKHFTPSYMWHLALKGNSQLKGWPQLTSSLKVLYLSYHQKLFQRFLFPLPPPALILWVPFHIPATSSLQYLITLFLPVYPVSLIPHTHTSISIAYPLQPPLSQLGQNSHSSSFPSQSVLSHNKSA